ncbi:hypothetical protein ATCC90586_002689 [Pythium insidiosum]|nr:hypothetical protein ATCC90586_002689 [Pythium insidiosum]
MTAVTRRTSQPNATPSAATAAAAPPATQEMDFDEYRQRFEPVAPWNRANIPDYGPLGDTAHVLIFVAIGLLATAAYECTDYFDQIGRVVAYPAIWCPLWFRLLARVSPQPTEQELDERERKQFKDELARIAQEADKIDE